MFEKIKKKEFGNHSENQFGYYESKKFKSAVKKLELLTGITSQAKVQILAVALDLKPAAEMDLHTNRENVEHFTNILSELGLFFFEDTVATQMIRDSSEQNGHNFEENPATVFVIGNTPETIAIAREIPAAHVSEHKKFGLAMGYPDTAVQAFTEAFSTNNFDVLLTKEEETNLLTEEEKKFLYHRLSKKEYAKEIESTEQIIVAVKKYSPKIYEQVMRKNNSSVFHLND